MKQLLQLAAIALIIIMLPFALLMLALCAAFGLTAAVFGTLSAGLAHAGNPLTGDTSVTRVAVKVRRDGRIVPHEVIEVLRPRRRRDEDDHKTD